MFQLVQLVIAMLLGKQSDGLATAFALKKGKTIPTLKDRCQAAMVIFSMVLILVSIFLSAEFPPLDSLFTSFIDWRIFYPFKLLIIMIGVLVLVPLPFLLAKLPFPLLTVLFIILLATFSSLMIYGITKV